MNDFNNGLYFYTNLNKESVVEPDVKPKALMNHSTLEGVAHLRPQDGHSMNSLKKL